MLLVNIRGMTFFPEVDLTGMKFFPEVDLRGMKILVEVDLMGTKIFITKIGGMKFCTEKIRGRKKYLLRKRNNPGGYFPG